MKKEKSRLKEYFLIPIILGIFLFSIYLISATNSMSTPVTNGNYTSPITVTVLYDGYNSQNMTNLTCYFNSSGGSSLELPVTIVNTTSTQTTFTGTKALTVETRAYNVTCLLQNSTSINSTFYAINVTIDNTTPTMATTTDQSTGYQKDSIGLNWSCTDATSGVQTTSVSLSANGDAGCTISGTTSWATATGSQSLLDTQTQCAGLYTIASSCSDYSGNSATDSDTFNIYYPTGGSGFIPDSDQVINPITKGTTSRTKLLLIIFGIVIFLVIVIVLSFYAISQTKKRR